MKRAEAIALRQQIESAATLQTDETALESKWMYPKFSDLVTARKKVDKGFRFAYGDKLYKTEQPEYTFDGQYKPDDIGVESLFSEVAKQGEGTRDNPIHYNGNMELFEGKYYEQNSILYLCTRDSGVPLYNNLSDLVGIYVQLA